MNPICRVTEDGLKTIILSVLLAISLAFTSATLLIQPVTAHEGGTQELEVGAYTLIIKWKIDPVIVGERNAVLIQVLEGEEPVSEEVAVDLMGTLLYGETSYPRIPLLTEAPGVYQVEVIPTTRGEYDFQISGTIGEETFEETVALEEVFPSEVFEFPEENPDVKAMINQVRNATILAILGLVAGIFSMGTAFYYSKAGSTREK